MKFNSESSIIVVESAAGSFLLMKVPPFAFRALAASGGVAFGPVRPEPMVSGF